LPELRKDVITGHWVIIASERSKRPQNFRIEPAQHPRGPFCPFCEGNESKTPPEVLARRRNGSEPEAPGWSLRVVPNKFPALHRDGEVGLTGDGLYESMSGVGAHEVIIETPEHQSSLAELSDAAVQDVLWAYRERIAALKQDPRIRYVLIFKNHGEAAGASLAHTHSQLIALPIVPIRVQRELDCSQDHFQRLNRCVFCEVIEKELQQKSRVIHETERFVTLSPYAARFPFESWILPKSHQAAFELCPTDLHAELAEVLKTLLQGMDRALEKPAYNFLLHTAPGSDDGSPSYHWHFEVIPRLGRVAGFEWGSGFYINPTAPETAAECLREAATLPHPPQGGPGIGTPAPPENPKK